MTEMIPPRPADEVREFITAAAQLEPEEIEQWVAAIEALLPRHAHQEGTTLRWSNQVGLWELFYAANPQAKAQPLQVHIRSGWDRSASGWQIADPHVGHVRSLLTAMGAIEMGHAVEG